MLQRKHQTISVENSDPDSCVICFCCCPSAKFTQEDRQHMASALTKRYYEPGQDMITQGDLGKEFFILISGVAQVLRVDEEKNEKKVAELHGGDYFGEAALLNNDRRQATIRAVEKCHALSLDAETFHKLFGKNKLNVHFAKRQAIAPEPVKNIQVNRDPALYKKSDEIKQFLAESMTKTTKIFKDFDNSQLTRVVEGMWRVQVTAGESIIKQGDPGDNFYVVEEGEFDIFKNGAKVMHAGKGICFGELALIYNAPRQATVTAVTDSTVWAVDRHAFRENLKKINKAKLEEYESFLITVPVFQTLLKSERLNVAEALEEVTFQDKHVIVRQGDVGETFFIVKEGEVIVTKAEDSKEEKVVAQCKRGDFFGELALLNSEPRAATVTAKGVVECLTLNRTAFNALLGPLREILARVDWEAKSPDAPRKASAPTERIKRDEIQIVGTLGRGSFGLVQLVKHKKTGKTYALKQISKSQVVELGQQEHVMSEKNVMSTMDHPFIIKLYSTFRDKDYLYFLLEVCLGGELFTLLRQQRLFDEPTAKFYAGCVVLAFEHMHHHNIIYRDLKPENLLLDPQGYIKIVDFGFAKICTELTYTLCGTPDYLAPEVIMGQGHAKGVDWWTLGVLIYEMLASYPPFYDEDPMETYKKILSGSVEYPKHFSKEVVDLLSRLLHPRATKRYGVIKGGAALIKNHAWFAGFDWEALYAKQIKAPNLPQVSDADDLHNFAPLADDELGFDFPPYVDDGSGWDKEF
eukprot:TRINITY_DN1854_c0_g1_i7.p1 TRINITY_DN1854_c0_g1~~TRINITY_DN1854_c0_g1_i7.p1  ORF type:complete len:749 (+),score=208.08 TRINITY_DN1854_c0_g1_i7:309-2555(+)